MRIILLFLFSINIYALQGMMNVIDKDNQWLEGDTKSVELVLWPTNELNVNKIKYLIEGKYLSDHFYISSIVSGDYSPNNPEAYVVEARATLVKSLGSRETFTWKYINNEVKFKYTGPKMVAEKQPLKDLVFIPTDLKVTKDYTFLILLIVIAILVAIYFGYKYFSKKREERTRKQNVEKWKNKILNLETREDIESIYEQRNIWARYFSLENEEVDLFLKKINQVQYKKDIESSEIKEIRDYVNRVKEFESVR